MPKDYLYPNVNQNEEDELEKLLALQSLAGIQSSPVEPQGFELRDPTTADATMASLPSQSSSVRPMPIVEPVKSPLVSMSQARPMSAMPQQDKSVPESIVLQPEREQVLAKVKQSLAEKYGLNKFSDEERAKVQAQIKEENSGPNWAAALAALGAGLQGKDAAASGLAFLKNQQEERNQKLYDFDKGREGALKNIQLGQELQGFEEQDALRQREQDPMSQESMLAQSLAAKMLPSKDFSKMSASQINKSLPSLSKIYDIEQRKLDRQDARSAQQESRSLVSQEKQQLRDEKKKAAVLEVEDRKRNIEENLASLKDMIKDKGTYEAFGSHNADIDRKVEQIATDMAKLQDPTSVARPSEVESVKKNLISSNMASMRNQTALDILDNFKSEIESRAKIAYDVRGLTPPAQQEKRQKDKQQPQSNAQEVVRKDKDGRLAVFDAQTKKFLRYK